MAAAELPINFTFKEALTLLSREERFMATVSAMNSLLISKGMYSAEEFESVFVQWAQAQLTKPVAERPRQR